MLSAGPGPVLVGFGSLGRDGSLCREKLLVGRKKRQDTAFKKCGTKSTKVFSDLPQTQLFCR